VTNSKGVRIIYMTVGYVDQPFVVGIATCLVLLIHFLCFAQDVFKYGINVFKVIQILINARCIEFIGDELIHLLRYVVHLSIGSKEGKSIL